jgi:hypothetical protein
MARPSDHAGSGVQLLPALLFLPSTHGLLRALMGTRWGKGLGMQDRMELAARYRARAETVRKIAAGIIDAAQREQLLAIAKDYEYLARDAETKAIVRGSL